MKAKTLDLLMAMIREYPVSGNTEALNRNSKRLQDYLEAGGVTCKIFPVNGLNVIYASKVPGTTPDYLLNGHMDVVPVSFEGQQVPKLEGNQLFGRGSRDCLGNVCCIAEFLTDLPADRSVGAVFSMDEEIGGFTTKAIAEQGICGKKSIIIMDSGYAGIAYAEKGILSVKLTARGTGGHASAPWAFDNPVDKLLDGYRKIRDGWKNPTEADNWHESMAATMLSGANVTNQIPDQAAMVLNVRYTESSRKDAILQWLTDTSHLEVSVLESCDPVMQTPDFPELLRMKECYERVLPGRNVSVYRMMGATDARHYAKYNVPILILGVNGKGAHSAKEMLAIDSIDILKSVLQDYVS